MPLTILKGRGPKDGWHGLELVPGQPVELVVETGGDTEVNGNRRVLLSCRHMTFYVRCDISWTNDGMVDYSLSVTSSGCLTRLIFSFT